MPTQTETGVGHIHVKVADLDRAITFYRDVMGFEVMQHYGGQAAFLSAGDDHHHIGLNTWNSPGGTAPPQRHTGLFHVAFVYPTRAALAETLKNVLTAGVDLTGAADHGISEAVYFNDPDGNGVEIYHDRPQSEWPRNPDGGLAMINQRLDLEGLLAEAEG